MNVVLKEITPRLSVSVITGHVTEPGDTRRSQIVSSPLRVAARNDRRIVDEPLNPILSKSSFEVKNKC
jgi:hypothetical protein